MYRLLFVLQWPCEGTSLQSYDGEWKRKACSYVNFSSKVHCHGCKESKNWDPFTEEQKKGKERKEAERIEVTRLKSEKDEREAREKGRELGWPEGWKWEDLEDEQLLELM